MQLKRQQPQQSGFTLIELIVVVVILGMMAMFVYPNYTKSVNKSYEKTGSNNLMIIYAAQRLKLNSGSTYQACADTAAVNANLNLSILGSGITYSCTIAGGPTFTCYATKGADFTLRITNANNTVCCSAGTCPSIAAC